METILAFIKRRFPVDCNWTTGNCFYFAMILSTRFHGKIFYDIIAGHFVAKIEDKYYDWNGVYTPSNAMEEWYQYSKKESQHWNRIKENVIN